VAGVPRACRRAVRRCALRNPEAGSASKKSLAPAYHSPCLCPAAAAVDAAGLDAPAQWELLARLHGRLASMLQRLLDASPGLEAAAGIPPAPPPPAAPSAPEAGPQPGEVPSGGGGPDEAATDAGPSGLERSPQRLAAEARQDAGPSTQGDQRRGEQQPPPAHLVRWPWPAAAGASEAAGPVGAAGAAVPQQQQQTQEQQQGPPPTSAGAGSGETLG
jgi:hypothetical protein